MRQSSLGSCDTLCSTSSYFKKVFFLILFILSEPPYSKQRGLSNTLQKQEKAHLESVTTGPKQFAERVTWLKTCLFGPEHSGLLHLPFVYVQGTRNNHIGSHKGG